MKIKSSYQQKIITSIVLVSLFCDWITERTQTPRPLCWQLGVPGSFFQFSCRVRTLISFRRKGTSLCESSWVCIKNRGGKNKPTSSQSNILHVCPTIHTRTMPGTRDGAAAPGGGGGGNSSGSGSRNTNPRRNGGSTVVPNLAEILTGGGGGSGGGQDMGPPMSPVPTSGGRTSAAAVTGGTPTSVRRSIVELEERDQLQKQREREAREALVAARGGAATATATTTTTAAPPKSQTRQQQQQRQEEQDRLIKQQAKQGYGGGAGGGGGGGGGGGNGPARTSSVVPNLAMLMSPGLDSVEKKRVAGLAGLPPPPMDVSGPGQQYEQQQQHQQQQPGPARSSSFVPNLAAQMGSDAHPAGPPPSTTTGPPPGGPFPTAEVVLGRQAGRWSGVSTLGDESVAAARGPSTSQKVASRPASSPPSREDQDRAVKEAEKMGRRAQPAMTSAAPPMAYQESVLARYEAVGMVFGGGGDEDGAAGEGGYDDDGDYYIPPPSAMMDYAPPGAESMQQQPPSPPGSVGTAHLPESEEAVRERFRAATLAMGGTLTREDEEQQLKQREREEREFLSASAHTNAASQDGRYHPSSLNPNSKLMARKGAAGTAAAGSRPSDAEIKAQAGGAAASSSSFSAAGRVSVSGSDRNDVDQSTSSLTDAKARARASRASAVQSATQGEMDFLSKSRGGRLSHRGSGGPAAMPENSDVVVVTASVPSVRASDVGQPVQPVPGAMAVSQGQAERRVKSSLTEQPRLVEAGSATIPLSYADAAASPARAAIVGGDSGSVGPEAATDEEMAGGGPAQGVPEESVPSPRPDEEPKSNAPPSKNGRRRMWIAAIVLVLVVAVAAGVGGALAASGGGGSGSGSPPATTAPEGGSSPSPTGTPSVYESDALKKNRAELGDVITPLPLLEDTTTAQYSALQWVADEDTISSPDDIKKLKTRYILAVFYFSLGGTNWIEGNSTWLDPVTDECTWAGVECNDDGLLSSITLDVLMNIIGSIPQELQFLSDMRKCSSQKHIDVEVDFFWWTFSPRTSNQRRFVTAGKLIIQNNQVTGLQGPIPQLGTYAASVGRFATHMADL
jgi:hypothetical protein